MPDDVPSSSNWTQGLRRWLSKAPETRDELVKLVEESSQYLEPDTTNMLIGVLDLPATEVREIMTPRPQVVGVSQSDNLEDILRLILQSNHSRYPIFESQDSDSVAGILLSKDLLPYLAKLRLGHDTSDFDIKRCIRQPMYIPEGSRSDILLKGLQENQVHMAVVVDEFGNTVGIVTMEDLLEEIVGDIADEHDDIEDTDANLIMPDPEAKGVWLIQSQTSIEQINKRFDTTFDDSQVDSLGGLIMQTLGEISDLEGQTVEINGWRFTILKADGRMIQTIRAVPSQQLSPQP